MDIDISLTETERNEFMIIECCKDIKRHFLELGGLLADYQDKALWSGHHKSFRDFIEMLEIGSYSWVLHLIDLWEENLSDERTEGIMNMSLAGQEALK